MRSVNNDDDPRNFYIVDDVLEALDSDKFRDEFEIHCDQSVFTASASVIQSDAAKVARLLAG